MGIRITTVCDVCGNEMQSYHKALRLKLKEYLDYGYNYTTRNKDIIICPRCRERLASLMRGDYDPLLLHKEYRALGGNSEERSI